MSRIAKLADLFDHAEKRARKRWAILKCDITNHQKLSRYVRTLQACERIRNTINKHTTHA